MAELRCTRVSVFEDELTRGKRYQKLADDETKQQVKVRNDRGHVRWYPRYCFDREIEPLAVLVDHRIDDAIAANEDGPIEVTVTLSNGDRRWCIVATPSALVSCGDWIPGTEVRFHYRNRHLLIVEKLTEEIIARMLVYIDSQGDLEDCTLPLATDDDS